MEWKDYHWKRAKEKITKRFPQFHCQNCGFLIQLNFYPTQEYGKLGKINCPNCKQKPALNERGKHAGLDLN